MEKRQGGCQAKDPEGSEGITGFRRRRPFTLKKLGARNPYPAEGAGWGKGSPKGISYNLPCIAARNTNRMIHRNKPIHLFKKEPAP
jgi:hypothetical protein